MRDNLNTTVIGRLGEQEAVKYLISKGYRITATNYRYSHREIDIIAENDEKIVFVEVKSRTDRGNILERYGRPAHAVTKQKQHFLYTAAYHYVKTNKTHKCPRFDVIEIYFNPSIDSQKPTIKHIHHIENAFLIKRYT